MTVQTQSYMSKKSKMDRLRVVQLRDMWMYQEKLPQD